jgi:hypothetical protein
MMQYRCAFGVVTFATEKRERVSLRRPNRARPLTVAELAEWYAALDKLRDRLAMRP